MKSVKVIILLAVVFFTFAFQLLASETITNKTILTLVKEGLGEDLIISKIKVSESQFDITTEEMLKLKKDGVSEKIIQTMIETASKSDTSKKKTDSTVNLVESSHLEEKVSPIEKEQKELSSTASNTNHNEDNIYYARCNLKVIKGNHITWVNWQSTPTFIPVNTRLIVNRSGNTASVVNAETNSNYTLDIGADGEVFLDKFISKKPIDMNQFSADVQHNIKNTLAKIGMTKQEVYTAMGPPTNIGNVRSDTKTYEDIMSADLWVYARRRFGKNIGVAFDPATGRANRTEGIWR